MSIKQTIQTASITALSSSLVSSLVTMLGVIWFSIRDPLEDLIVNEAPKSILLLLPIIMLCISISLVSYVILLKKRLQLKPALGVYWDKNLAPHCPSCKTMLCNYAFYPTRGGNVPGFQCVKCSNKTIHLSDDQNIFIELKEAKEMVKACF